MSSTDAHVCEVVALWVLGFGVRFGSGFEVWALGSGVCSFGFGFEIWGRGLSLSFGFWVVVFVFG